VREHPVLEIVGIGNAGGRCGIAVCVVMSVVRRSLLSLENDPPGTALSVEVMVWRVPRRGSWNVSSPEVSCQLPYLRQARGMCAKDGALAALGCTLTRMPAPRFFNRLANFSGYPSIPVFLSTGCPSFVCSGERLQCNSHVSLLAVHNQQVLRFWDEVSINRLHLIIPTRSRCHPNLQRLVFPNRKPQIRSLVHFDCPE
jgi:hypothetical protein